MTTVEQVDPIDRVARSAPAAKPVISQATSRGDEMLLRKRGDVWIEAIDDWTRWMQSRNISEHTIRQWRWQLRHLGEKVGFRSPWKLSSEDLYTWYTSQDWAPATMKNARSCVCSFYQWATLYGRTKRDPAIGLRGVAVKGGTPRPAPDAAVKRAMRNGTDNIRLMVMMADLAGMRCGEIAESQWSDVGEKLLLVHGKGGKERYVPLHRDLADTLAAEYERRHDGRHGTGWHYTTGGDTWIFPSRKGRSVGGRWVSQHLSKALGPGVTAHMLRHGFASRMLDDGANLRVVQELLGHASASTTQIYTRVPSGAAIDVVHGQRSYA